MLCSSEMHLLNRYGETITDGPGLRYSIYLAGCPHRCPGCHNPQSWDPAGGIPLDELVLEGIIEEILDNPLLDGITISGGDPFMFPDELTVLTKRLKEETGLPILCYTGYTIEQIETNPTLSKPLPYIDLLIDGPFVMALKKPDLLFRGSSNQRLIDLNEHRNSALLR